MKRTAIILAAAALLLGATFAAGRWSRPAKVVTRVETQTVVKVEWRERLVEKRVEGPVRIRTVTRERQVPGACQVPGQPAPVERETEVTEERGPVVVDRQGEQSERAVVWEQGRQEKTEENGAPRLLLAVQVTEQLSQLSLSPSWTFSAAYRFAGPVNVVASLGTDGRASFGLGLEF